eukprot:CAMPEP_0202711582 /NCGR_PEP_ID=MMETSP1385-20130828/23345_1 /ASSEMBLY_ACC=CAM_ASM_000861 /TAXON_ID=933848 /ORGANISM="Elphidium margaritaceum" /LENGTH=272 /DNA_ID=CAMNT_0049371335 /DNA_START=137 /DNA_END=951 /DNA_ORIENTATION=+
MLDRDNGADMTAELDIARETTTLYLRSYVANVWFGISFNERQHSAEHMAVIFNANGDRQLHDVLLSADYSVPTLLPSQWTLVYSMQYGNMTSIIATRPNVIFSDAGYANFSECQAYGRLSAMWARGVSEVFADHGPLNRVSRVLLRDGVESTYEPTVEPTTAWPTTTSPTTASPTTDQPTTSAPSTSSPTSASPTKSPTTSLPTTNAPTTKSPTRAPTTFPTVITVFPTTAQPSMSTTDSIDEEDIVVPGLTTTTEETSSTDSGEAEPEPEP